MPRPARDGWPASSRGGFAPASGSAACAAAMPRASPSGASEAGVAGRLVRAMARDGRYVTAAVSNVHAGRPVSCQTRWHGRRPGSQRVGTGCYTRRSIEHRFQYGGWARAHLRSGRRRCRPRAPARGAFAGPRRPPSRGHPGARSPHDVPSPTGWTRGSGRRSPGRGIQSLYTHQAEAMEAIRAGHDVVRRDADRIGQEPVLRAARPAGDSPTIRPRARSCCSPPRRSARTRCVAFRELAAAAGLAVSAATYDGDTPAPIRSAVRTAGQVVVTNPDMLHAAILPHHTKWFQLFEQVQVIVIDELHTYRGVFGSHVANVIRRLLRVCRHYGSNPVIVSCSATIANPAELATALTGRRAAGRRPQRGALRRAPRAAGGPARHRRRRPGPAARP